jgi:hypothetical protein
MALLAPKGVALEVAGAGQAIPPGPDTLEALLLVVPGR